MEMVFIKSSFFQKRETKEKPPSFIIYEKGVHKQKKTKTSGKKTRNVPTEESQKETTDLNFKQLKTSANTKHFRKRDD